MTGDQRVSLRALAILEAQEWHALLFYSRCTVCGRDRRVGHRSDCWLAQALTVLRETEASS